MFRKTLWIVSLLLLVGCSRGDSVTSKLELTETNSIKQSEEKEYIPKLDLNPQLKKKIIGLKPIKKVKVGSEFLIKGIKSVKGVDANDPGIKAQWAISYTNSALVWEKIEPQKVVKIAVIDTGIDYNHEDLKNRINKSDGYDFVNDDDDPMDDNGHGTHVAGIIAAEMNNNIGIAGIMGPIDVEIIPIKALDSSGSGNLKMLRDSIEYAVNLNVDIINLSLGAVSDDKDLKDILQFAVNNGVFVVAAAGNEKQDCNDCLPAGMKGVYTIAATNPLNKPAIFSNYGTSVDVSAPGVKIVSSVIGNQYEAWDGTSMAAPIVTGIAGMMLTHNPDLAPEKLGGIIDKSARDISKEGKDDRTGNGLIDALECFNLLEEEEKDEIQ